MFLIFGGILVVAIAAYFWGIVPNGFKGKQG
jgi:hypothetical protein